MPDEPVTTTTTTTAGTTTADGKPAAGAAGTTPVVTPPAPTTVTISSEQYQLLAAMAPRIAELETQQRQRDDAARVEQLRLMAEQGQATEALRLAREDAERRVNAEKTERAAEAARAKRYAVVGELARSLADKPLVPGAAEQLTQLWSGQLNAEPQGDSYAVRTPGGQTAADFVAAQLALANYSHFIRSTAAGGAGASGGDRSTPTPDVAATTVVPQSIDQAIAMDAAAKKKEEGGDPRFNKLLPFGLRRIS